MNEGSAFIRKDMRKISLLYHMEKGSQFSSDMRSASTLVLYYPASRITKNQCLFFNVVVSYSSLN